jgi:hypothetical protein
LPSPIQHISFETAVQRDKEAKHAGEFKLAHYTRREFKNFATLHFDVLEGDDRGRADPERALLRSVCDMNVVGLRGFNDI